MVPVIFLCQPRASLVKRPAVLIGHPLDPRAKLRKHFVARDPTNGVIFRVITQMRQIVKLAKDCVLITRPIILANVFLSNGKARSARPAYSTQRRAAARLKWNSRAQKAVFAQRANRPSRRRRIANGDRRALPNTLRCVRYGIFGTSTIKCWR